MEGCGKGTSENEGEEEEERVKRQEFRMIFLKSLRNLLSEKKLRLAMPAFGKKVAKTGEDSSGLSAADCGLIR